tara:strand:+ start:735 stop:887 length:153 start_codon:yes stop_codon:yes gene_type:complete
MTRSLDDIYDYRDAALATLSTDHPHYEEIRDLLTEQVEDEVSDYAHTRTN